MVGGGWVETDQLRVAGLAKCLDADCTSLATSPTGIEFKHISMTIGPDGAPLIGYNMKDDTLNILHCASAYTCGN